MTVRTSAGSTIKLSASAPATFDASGYNALSYTTVGEASDLGEFGREFALVTHMPVSTRGTQKFKGSFNEGSLTIQMGLDTDDSGQILAKAASMSDNAYSFLITTQNGDKYYFQARVMSFKVNIGGVDTITAATMMVEITTSATGVGIVEVLA